MGAPLERVWLEDFAAQRIRGGAIVAEFDRRHHHQQLDVVFSVCELEPACEPTP